MRKKSLSKALFALMLILLLALAACNSDSEKGSKSSEGSSGENTNKEEGDEATPIEPDENGVFSLDDFEKDAVNDGDAIDGGELKFGLVSDTAFDGTLNYNFYSGNPDSEVIQWFDESLFDTDENYVYTNDGAASYEANDDGTEFTLKIRDEVNWQDGEPVTAEDWAFAYEVIGDPDYDGVRYGSDFTNVEGMDEYHKGKADDISGIEIIDEKTLKITFLKATPSLVTGGIWPYALPKHIFEDIPVADMSSSDEVRKNPVGMGPYKVESIVEGESVVFSKNEEYWRGEPGLDKVTLEVINPSTVVQAIKGGDVDLVNDFPAEQFPDNADLSNVQFLGNIDLSYSYIGFKLGTWDEDEGEVAPDPNMKMNDKELRKAMWQAIDNESVGEKFYHGLRWNATTLIPPSHPQYYDDSIEGVKFDPEAAKQTLDDAGYVDTDDDGFREDPDGNELTISFASKSEGEVTEPLTKYYIQAWEDVGLKVELLDGKIQEFNAFYDRVGQNGDDDPKVDIYLGAWGVGSDVNPDGLYGRDAIFNFPRYASDENDELLEAGISEEAFDMDKRKEIYSDWQELMVEEMPVIPTLYQAEIIPINKRVKNYSLDEGSDLRVFDISVTEEDSEVAE